MTRRPRRRQHWGFVLANPWLLQTPRPALAGQTPSPNLGHKSPQRLSCGLQPGPASPQRFSHSCTGVAGPGPAEGGSQSPELALGGHHGEDSEGIEEAPRSTGIQPGLSGGHAADGALGRDSGAPAPMLGLSIAVRPGMSMQRPHPIGSKLWILLRAELSKYSSVLPPTAHLLPLHTQCRDHLRCPGGAGGQGPDPEWPSSCPRAAKGPYNLLSDLKAARCA